MSYPEIMFFCIYSLGFVGNLLPPAVTWRQDSAAARPLGPQRIAGQPSLALGM